MQGYTRAILLRCVVSNHTGRAITCVEPTRVLCTCVVFTFNVFVVKKNSQILEYIISITKRLHFYIVLAWPAVVFTTSTIRRRPDVYSSAVDETVLGYVTYLGVSMLFYMSPVTAIVS